MSVSEYENIYSDRPRFNITLFGFKSVEVTKKIKIKYFVAYKIIYFTSKPVTLLKKPTNKTNPV